MESVRAIANPVAAAPGGGDDGRRGGDRGRGGRGGPKKAVRIYLIPINITGYKLIYMYRNETETSALIARDAATDGGSATSTTACGRW